MFRNILLTKAESQKALFETVADKLKSEGYVTQGYCEALKEREKEFPTGLKIDLGDGSDILYAAIPHTEVEYCLRTQVVYVRNESRLNFKHMINPEEECQVSDFFFIINNRNDGQTEVLSQLMDFFVTKGNLPHLQELTDEDAIENYLKAKGVF
ncbi:PTS sugar transporter subunit IIA [Streptococcus orisasini]|uniref:PTS sugar transporter subunit IIA n=1 Tax=Streptococcus orisasini TaxID=1080071 RepID=UPI000709F797|nr:PTS sugar transporter subunit IIA [Streptococcus orisasini]